MGGAISVESASGVGSVFTVTLPLARVAQEIADSAAAAQQIEAEPEPEDAGARLIALNMALNGSPRDDTRVFLEEHFDLADVEALLDDVYARAGR
jgi:hypothetical protein